MSINNCFIVFFTFFLIMLYILYNKTVSILSNIDKRYYRVKNTKDAQTVADSLGMLNNKIELLLNSLRSEYENKPYSRYLEYEKNVKLLLERYNPDSLMENFLPFGTSLTVNKGDYIGMCVIHSDNSGNNVIINENVLMFVMLHELAHVGCESKHHTKEFINFFRFLIKTSMRLGIYEYIDYSKYPVNYCGLELKSNII